MVVLLIILNIILIVLFSILIWYIIKSNKHDTKCVCKDDNCEINESIKIKEMVLKAQRYTATFAGYQWNWNIECRKWGKENAGRI